MKTLLVGLLAALASMVDLTVGMGDLRVSLGIVVLVLALFFEEGLDPVATGLVTGLAVFGLRIFMAAVTVGVDVGLAFSYLLEVLFYLGYGLLLLFAVRKDKEKENNPLILLLMICDFGANAIEFFARYIVLGDNFESLTLQNLFLAAFVRSALIWIGIKLIKEKKIVK